MRNKKRSVDQVPDLEERSLLQRVRAAPEPYRSYACFCYLFGNRVSEGLGIPKREVVDYYVYPKLGRKGKKLEVRVPKYVEFDPSLHGYELAPLQTWQIHHDEQQGVLWVKSIPTLKRPKRPLKNVPVLIDGVGEKPFIDMLLHYVNNKDKNEYLWTFNRKQAYNNFMKYFGIMPHKFRSLRATKDVSMYELDAKELMEKYQWSNAGVALHYVQKTQKNLIEKMKRKTEENKWKIAS